MFAPFTVLKTTSRNIQEVLSENVKNRVSGLTFIIAISLTRLSPNPDIAPSRPATDCEMQSAARAPSQLKTKETETTTTLPMRIRAAQVTK